MPTTKPPLRSITYSNSSENPSTVIRQILFQVTDGTTSSNSFVRDFRVLSVNDAPSFTTGPNQTVAEDAAAQSVPGWATNFVPGPAAEAAQALTLTVTNDNNAIFTVQPAVDIATGTLSFTPAPNANGLATVTLVLRDNGGVSNGGVDSASQTITINITAVNDVPTAASQTVSTNEDMAVAITLAGGDVDGTPLTFNITQPTRGTLSGTAPNLTYMPNANLNGADSFTYSVSDGKASSTTATVQINVISVNDLPVISSGPTAAPNPALITDIVSFTVAASDDTPGLVISWTFGDGSGDTTNNATVSHNYPIAGIYTVNVTVTDAAGATSVGSVVVRVGAPSLPGDFDADGIGDLADTDDDDDGITDVVEVGAGTNPYDADSAPQANGDTNGNGIADGLESDADGDSVSTASEFNLGTNPFNALSVEGSTSDSDGDGIIDSLDPDDDNDGFSDQLEWKRGSNPHDVASTSAGLAFLPLSVKSLRTKLNFETAVRDRITLHGLLTVSSTFRTTGASVIVDVGGNVQDFLLTSKGVATRGVDRLKVQKSGAVRKFSLKLRQGNYNPNLKDERLTGEATIRKAQRELEVTVLVEGAAFRKVQPQTYSAKAGKSGRTK